MNTSEATKNTLQRGKELAKLYRDLIAIEADIVIYVEMVMKYQHWLDTGTDDRGNPIDGEKDETLTILIADLLQSITESAEIAWDVRNEIARLISESIAEANSVFLAATQGLKGYKSIYVSPK